jgi:exodeoxyribonuclease-1
MRMVQAASLFSPNALAPAFGDDGKRSYKLDRVAPANGFSHEHAHDALADVEATIFVCRMIAEKAPEIWSAFMRFSQKAAVSDYVSSELIFSLSDFYFGKPYSWLVTSVGSNPKIASELYAFDLSVSPEELADLSNERLARRLETSPKPIRKIKSNASPIIMPAEDAPPIAAAIQLGMEEVTRRAEFIQSDDQLRQRLIETVLSLKPEPEESIYVENQLYSSFFPQADQQRLDAFHLVPWEQRLSIVEAFEDSRLKTIGRRLIHTERPDLFSAKERAGFDKAVAERLLGGKDEVPWLTLTPALAEIDELIQSAEPDDSELLRGHREHLVERQDRARKTLR